MKTRIRLAMMLLVCSCQGGTREAVNNGNGAIHVPPANQMPDVIYVPTKMEVVEQMLTLAQVDSTDLVYDLGSGDGRIVITAASRRGARGVGIDIDPQRIRESNANADSAGVSHRVEFRRADLFRTDLRTATAVTLYLLPSLNVKLRPRLFSQLRPGTPVVSNSFDMDDWRPDSAVEMDNRHVYLWYIPANATGEWLMEFADGNAAGRTELLLAQRYQDVLGTIRVDGRADSLRNTRLRGDSIYFTTTINGVPRALLGTVSGANMTGASRDGAVSWTAHRRGPARSPIPVQKFR